MTIHEIAAWLGAGGFGLVLVFWWRTASWKTHVDERLESGEKAFRRHERVDHKTDERLAAVESSMHTLALAFAELTGELRGRGVTITTKDPGR